MIKSWPEMKRPLFFIKFGKKEHLERLLEFGELYFNPLVKFSNSSEPERGDEYEGSSKILNDQFTKIECDHKTLGHFEFTPVDNKSKMIVYNDNIRLSLSVYSLSTDILSRENPYPIDKRMKTFGDHALWIQEPKVFLERLVKHFKSHSIEYGLDWITYQNYDAVGEIKTDFFCKTSELSHQREFRIIVGSETEESQKIAIGSLKDIAVLVTSDQMTEFKFSVNTIKAP